ncbi:MAG TPA: hypothetical protein VFT74_00280 [Isosphaeraceae bacterium]|nr:hypothetical protein [Isosphaeraceae bacterium]
MDRPLATVIFGYAGLCAALWWLASRAMVGGHWCGNMMTDPLGLMINVGAPVALYCSVVLSLFCLRDRHWPRFAVFAFMAFLTASAGLAIETKMLADYGLEIASVWWLPGR